MKAQEINAGSTYSHKDGTIFMKFERSLFYLDRCRICGTEIVVRVDQERLCSDCDEREKRRLRYVDDGNAKMASRDEELQKREKRRERLKEWRRRKREAEKEKVYASCQWCGKEFEKKRREQKFCSEKCEEKQRKLYTRGEKRKCIICGKTYIATVKHQKYCGYVCRVKGRALAEGEQYVPSPKTAKCKFCGKKFTPRNRVNCFCSESCANRYYAQKQREYRLKRREEAKES